MQRKIIDCSTGEVRVVDLTPEEIAAAEAATAAENTPSKVAMRRIAELEGGVTPRRMREAALGIDGGWLAAREAQIAALRAQL